MGNELIDRQNYSFTFTFSLKIPASERSTIPSIAQTGTNFGIIITTPLVSLMAESKFLGGWPSAFYVFGRIKNIILSLSFIMIRYGIVYMVYLLVFLCF